MKGFLGILGMILCLLAVSPSRAEEDRVQFLIRQAETAISQDDIEQTAQYLMEMNELFYGLGTEQEDIPGKFSMTNYQKELCLDRKATALLFTPAKIKRLQHIARVLADGLVHRKEENEPYVHVILECTQDNGDPVPTAKALREGFSWVKKLNEATIEEAHAMGQEYEALLEQHPGDFFYDMLNDSVDIRIRYIREEEERREEKKRYPKGRFYQIDLVNKADKGVLAAQLEVARGIETGTDFRQHNAMAYFWYKHALQNGGGDVAQAGMDRLHPHLWEGDFQLIDMWTEEGRRPYQPK